MSGWDLLKKDARNYFVQFKCKSIFDKIKVVLQAPSLWAIASFRLGSMVETKFLKGVYFFLIWNPIRIITGIEIFSQTKIKEKLYMPHFGGIFINPNAVIGKNCRILNDVTIGAKKFGHKESPTIGNDVTIGTGAKVLGPIKVGDGAIIGAGCVVMKSVPEGATVVNVSTEMIVKGK